MTNQTGQTLDGVIDGLKAIAVTVYGASLGDDGNYYASLNGQQLLVCEGEPDSYQPDLIVAIALDVRQPVDRPTLGTTRSRERAAEIDIAFSAFVAGGGQAQATARKQCSAMVDPFEDYFRTQGNETLSFSCREAFVSNIAGPVLAVATDPSSGAVSGRIAEATVTVTAYIRY